MAKALTTFFVFRNFGVLEGWNEGTCIAEVVPLYGNDDAIKAYCVKLQNGSVQAGYVTVSTNLHETLIQEYSDQALPVFEVEKTLDKESVQYMIEADDVQKVYYYGPLRYASQKQNNEVPTVYSKEEIVDHYEENFELISSLLPLSKRISSLEQRRYIENIYDYLAELKPGDSYRVYSGSQRLDLDGYVIRGRYMFWHLLHYYPPFGEEGLLLLMFLIAIPVCFVGRLLKRVVIVKNGMENSSGMVREFCIWIRGDYCVCAFVPLSVKWATSSFDVAWNVIGLYYGGIIRQEAQGKEGIDTVFRHRCFCFGLF